MSGEASEFAVRTGPWLRDPVVGVCRGALAVPLDDATGYLIAASSSPDRWPVSMSMRLDFLTDPPTDGSVLQVAGERLALDHRLGATRGRVLTQEGDLVALITHRSHLLTVGAPPPAPEGIPEAPGDTRLREALGVRVAADGVVDLPPSAFAANGMQNVHGGILVVLAEFAAMTTVGAEGGYRTTSIDMTYVRPCRADVTTRFRADLVHRGRSLSVIEVVGEGPDGRVCVMATVVIQEEA